MRFIKSFILRLYVDTAMPKRLCGDLRPLNERESQPFKSEAELGELLNCLTGGQTRQDAPVSEKLTSDLDLPPTG